MKLDRIQIDDPSPRLLEFIRQQKQRKAERRRELLKAAELYQQTKTTPACKN